MSDTETPAADAPVQAPVPPAVRVITQYIRDLSFENPRAPGSLINQTEAPKIDLQVEMNAQRREDGFYELELQLTVSAKRGEDVAFHVQLVYGGLFQIDSVPDQELEAVLLIECPRYLFPFARRIISELTAEGGYPPFRMDPLDFAGIYMARQEQLAAQGGPVGNA